jgi:peptidoglycan/xylan/chitin deacetylase (PgdA/CDA1 family)
MSPLLEHRETQGIILMYHRVADVDLDTWSLCVSPQHFADQLEVIRGLANPIHLRDLCDPVKEQFLASPWIALTFDDGYADNFNHAGRILRDQGIPATFFPLIKYLGSKERFWWDELEDILLRPGILPPLSDLRMDLNSAENYFQNGSIYSEEEFQRYRKWCWEDPDPTLRHTLFRLIYGAIRLKSEEERPGSIQNIRTWAGKTSTVSSDRWMLSPDEVFALSRDRLFEIGAHTLTHPDLASLSTSQQQEEILQSKASLENLIRQPVYSFSYPYGLYNEGTLLILRNSGIQCAVSTVEGNIGSKTDRLLLPRFQVKDWPADEFASRISQYFKKTTEVFIQPG